MRSCSRGRARGAASSRSSISSTRASDAECYPLRQQDLVVLEVSPLRAPMVVQWGIDTSNRKNVIHDIPNLGFSGDQLHRPLFMDDEWRPYVCFSTEARLHRERRQRADT
jgi:hypothetical protein